MQLGGKFGEVKIRRAAQGEFDMARVALAVYGETRRIRASICQHGQHICQMATKFRLQRPVFQEKACYAAHGLPYLSLLREC
jgi:hypothetical protein